MFTILCIMLIIKNFTMNCAMKSSSNWLQNSSTHICKYIEPVTDLGPANKSADNEALYKAYKIHTGVSTCCQYVLANWTPTGQTGCIW